jgi:hypothetical protein
VRSRPRSLSTRDVRTAPTAHARVLYGEERERAITEFLEWYAHKDELRVQFEGTPIKKFADSRARVSINHHGKLHYTLWYGSRTMEVEHDDDDTTRESKLTDAEVGTIRACYRALYEARRAWKMLQSKYDGRISPGYMYQVGRSVGRKRFARTPPRPLRTGP